MQRLQQSIGMMHHSGATKLCVCIQVTNWAINHGVPQQSYCRGAGLSLCVPHFHFLPCGAPPFSLSLHNHSLTLCQLGSPHRSFLFSLSRCPCSVISLMLGHFAPSLSLYSLPHWLTPHLFFKHSDNPILYLLLLLSFHPVFLHYSLHRCLKQQQKRWCLFEVQSETDSLLKGTSAFGCLCASYMCICWSVSCTVMDLIILCTTKKERALHVLIWYQPWHWLAGFSTSSMKILWNHSCFKNRG